MNLLSVFESLFLDVVNEEIAVLGAYGHPASSFLQCEVCEGMPFPNCSGLDMGEYLEVALGKSEYGSLVVGATHKYLSNILAHELPIDGGGGQLMSSEMGNFI